MSQDGAVAMVEAVGLCDGGGSVYSHSNQGLCKRTRPQATVRTPQDQLKFSMQLSGITCRDVSHPSFAATSARAKSLASAAPAIVTSH